MDTNAPTKKGVVPVVKARGPIGIAYWEDVLRPLKPKNANCGDIQRGNRCDDNDEDQEDSLEGGSPSGAACVAASSDGNADNKSRFSDEPW